jgi:glycosyltransferase involved in cell wall biosynthesis
VLEAMVLGCPVVVSNQASLPEICSDAALYASPTDPEAWLTHFLRLKQDNTLRTQLTTRGRTQAAKFSWRASAELYLRAMARADGMEVGGSVSE